MQPRGFEKQPKKPKLQVVDATFENEVERFVEAVLAEEKQAFQPGVESFEVHAGKIRQELGDAMHAFHRNYHNGYQAICEELDRLGLARPQVSDQNLAIFDDTLAFTEALDEGKAIYQLLGFTPEVMRSFYQIAISLAETNKYDKARDAFYFLASIASDIALFWLGLGMCNARLDRFDLAVDNFRRAIELDPQNSDAYLGCIHALMKDNRSEEAITLCDAGLRFAEKNQNAPWAEKLASVLEEANQFVRGS